ncbi:MAG: DUF2294 domain-containing protein [Actinobacteria bacterium]|nr:DUF2294 domain-containing protein [Actinomycetota bacterium]MCG2818123.1 DUF2294 domain-containing protein [Actinomycetes bacterium]MBU4179605.1 DUF2294 domain-containing protein [Actinomycetota bacterium]MBU4218924.1 DUF2294 domain-containing protein [Actinomycetota bacterium]MBU4359671.1 DUF2294 domain-containing protein [Actinomycetota bacterium]
MTKKTKGQIEAEISNAIIKFEKEYMGRGPVETKTYIIDDMVLVRMQGLITKAEHHLASTGNAVKGRELLKQTRIELIEKARPSLEPVIESIVGESVKSLHMDISTKTGEKIIIFTLEKPPKLS